MSSTANFYVMGARDLPLPRVEAARGESTGSGLARWIEARSLAAFTFEFSGWTFNDLTLLYDGVGVDLGEFERSDPSRELAAAGGSSWLVFEGLGRDALLLGLKSLRIRDAQVREFLLSEHGEVDDLGVRAIHAAHERLKEWLAQTGAEVGLLKIG